MAFQHARAWGRTWRFGVEVEIGSMIPAVISFCSCQYIRCHAGPVKVRTESYSLTGLIDRRHFLQETFTFLHLKLKDGIKLQDNLRVGFGQMSASA